MKAILFQLSLSIMTHPSKSTEQLPLTPVAHQKQELSDCYHDANFVIIGGTGVYEFMTTSGVVNDDKVGIMSTRGFLCMKLYSPLVECLLLFQIFIVDALETTPHGKLWGVFCEFKVLSILYWHCDDLSNIIL